MVRVIRPSLLLLFALGAVALALLLTGVLGGSGPAAAGAATARHHARSHHAQRHHSKTRHARTAQAGDRDNIQAGDQNAPENSAQENAGENTGENESANEPAGEAQPGHEDPAGQNVDHQCPPDCAPGELP